MGSADLQLCAQELLRLRIEAMPGCGIHVRWATRLNGMAGRRRGVSRRTPERSYGFRQ